MNRVRLGMLTPSSNTVLEPVCARMLHGLPEVTPHFARFRVTEIALTDAALGQFDLSPQLAAADLLADAQCQVICWNGTSAGWLGLEHDRRLCTAVTARTGIPATSSVLAIEDIFRRTGVRRYGLVSPYTDQVQSRIVENLAAEGFACAAEMHHGISVNYDFALIDPETIAQSIRTVAREKPDAIVVWCTNMQGAALAPSLEAETGVPLYDSVATAVWGGLRLAGVDTARVEGWGRLFAEVR